PDGLSLHTASMKLLYGGNCDDEVISPVEGASEKWSAFRRWRNRLTLQGRSRGTPGETRSPTVAATVPSTWRPGAHNDKKFSGHRSPERSEGRRWSAATTRYAHPTRRDVRSRRNQRRK